MDTYEPRRIHPAVQDATGSARPALLGETSSPLRCSITVERDIVPGTRLDEYLGRHRAVLPSKKAAYKRAKRGEILVNGDPAPPHSSPCAGDRIDIVIPPPIALPPCPHSLSILYCDPWMVIVNKPAGIPVMGLFDASVELACASILPPPATADQPLPRPKPVHRLDVPTTGLLVLARTEGALRELSRQFRDREVRKTYRAVVAGRLCGSGVLDSPLDGKPSHSAYRCDPPVPSLKTEWVTPVTLQPRTGRTHQLRRHLAGVGHPIIGDREHSANQPVFRGKGLFLSATGLCLRHPIRDHCLGLTIAQPHKFTSYLRREARRCQGRSPRSPNSGGPDLLPEMTRYIFGEDATIQTIHLTERGSCR